MKKSRFAIFLFIMCLVPCLGFFGCASPDSHLITALPSDSTFGIIQGVDNLSEGSEGTKLTLLAVEKDQANHPFLCWIKDYKEIVSEEKELKLTYNSSTAGNYTAVYKESDLSKMMFVKFNNPSDFTITLTDSNGNSVGINNVQLSLQWSRVDAGSINYNSADNINFILSNKDVNVSGEQQQTLPGFGASLTDVDANKVLYFGKAGDDFKYSFSGTLSYEYTISGTLYTDTLTLSFENYLSKSSDYDNGKTSLSATISIPDKITRDKVLQLEFNFEKIGSPQTIAIF